MAGLRLNYHHLHYFWAVAREGNLTRAARNLGVAQSALSAQIRQLEEQLGGELFERRGRGLELTEAGKIALVYADDIFSAGSELVATLTEGRRRSSELRIGAAATLSRNFHESFVKPLLAEPGLRLRFVAGSMDDMLGRLADHTLDVVLANGAVERDPDGLRCWLLARQKVSLVSQPTRRFVFPEDLGRAPLLLPGPDNALRTAFDAMCQRSGIAVQVFAEVDDMAMLRLLARSADCVALVPPVVVRDELSSGVLSECCVVPDLYEEFYAITSERRYPHPLLAGLLVRTPDEILGEAGTSSSAPLPG